MSEGSESSRLGYLSLAQLQEYSVNSSGRYVGRNNALKLGKRVFNTCLRNGVPVVRLEHDKRGEFGDATLIEMDGLCAMLDEGVLTNPDRRGHPERLGEKGLALINGYVEVRAQFILDNRGEV